MKVFIHYEPRHLTDSFEGTRLRKTLKGACELVDVPWVDTPQEGVGIAHFLSPMDMLLLKAQKEAGVKTVISAFYAEDDPGASFLKEGKELRLAPRALEFLNEADLVLVPDERMKEFALGHGVTSTLKILEPAVRMNRFSNTAIEKPIFTRYFGLKPGVKTVVATGSYSDKKTINLIKNVAKSCPNLQFYFFGAKRIVGSLFLSRMPGRPKNLHFMDLVQDDIYRSALMNSAAYISNDSVRPDVIGALEAFASKTQVVAFNSPKPNPLLKAGESCFFFSTAEEMGRYLATLNSDSHQSTIEPAYAIAKAHNLVSYGKILKGYYEALLQEPIHD